MNGEGKNAIVTGVSSGIGAYVTEFLLQDGWSVFGLSRGEPVIQHERFDWYRCDLSDAQAIGSWTQHLRVPIDLVVHNAGVTGGVGPGLDLDLTAWRDAFEVNFFAPLLLTQHLRARCRANACFVFLSGGGAVTQRPLVGPYAISKLAIVKLAEQLSLEYSNLRFYGLAPGAHPTRLFDEQQRQTHAAAPTFADLADVTRLLQVLIADADARLNGKLVHVRDDLEKLLSAHEGGMVRRVERR